MMTAVAIVSIASVTAGAGAAPAPAPAPEATAQSDASTSSSTQSQPQTQPRRRSSSNNNNSMRDNSLRDSMRMRSSRSSTRRRSATSPMSQRVTAGAAGDMRQQPQRQSYQQVPAEDAGGEENNNHYRMTLLTEFRQIVQYTRTKRRSPKNRNGATTSVSNNGEVKKRSFQSPPKNALRKKRIVGIGNPHYSNEQSAGEETREPPLRRATHSFNDRIKKSTFSRNVDYLQEQTKQSFERRLSNASTSSLTSTTVDTAASSISSSDEEENAANNSTNDNAIPSSPTGLGRYLAVQRSASFNAVLDWKNRNRQHPNVMEDESISIHDHQQIDDDDDERSECPSEMSYGGGSEILSSSLLDTILRGGSIKGSIKESTFHKNVDYLQAKTEELSRSVHGSSRSLMYNHYQQEDEAGEQPQAEEEAPRSPQQQGGEGQGESEASQEEEISRSIIPKPPDAAIYPPQQEDATATAAPDAATSSSSALTYYYGLDYFHNVMTQTIQECLEEDAASCCSSGEGGNASMHGSLAMASGDGEFPPSTFAKNVDYLQETAHGFTQSVLETSEEFTKSVVETTTSVVETAVSYTTFEDEDEEEAPASAEQQDNKEEVAPQEENETDHQAAAVSCSNIDDQREEEQEEEEVANVEEKEEQVEQDNNDKNLFLRNVDFLQEQAEELTKSWATGLSSWWAGSGGN